MGLYLHTLTGLEKYGLVRIGEHQRGAWPETTLASRHREQVQIVRQRVVVGPDQGGGLIRRSCSFVTTNMEADK